VKGSDPNMQRSCEAPLFFVMGNIQFVARSAIFPPPGLHAEPREGGDKEKTNRKNLKTNYKKID
jgi:hypothetical protein